MAAFLRHGAQRSGPPSEARALGPVADDQVADDRDGPVVTRADVQVAPDSTSSGALNSAKLPPEISTLYRQVKVFDFDERPLGNFEDLPMNWVQLTDAKMPGFNEGAFDGEVGHAAPPSFRLDITGGSNVAFEYQGRDLSVMRESDYVIIAHVRTQQVQNARAFLAAYLVDRYGERIAGSERISRLIGGERTQAEAQAAVAGTRNVPADAGGVRSGAPQDPPLDAGPVPPVDGTPASVSNANPAFPEVEASGWQRIELVVPGDFRAANALRLQFWMLQPEMWQSPSPGDVDPIRRQDVLASAWLDDVTVYRLPRARLRLSDPAGLVAPGEPEHFTLDVTNATRQTLQAELLVTDAEGAARRAIVVAVPPFQSDPTVVPVPELDPGWYHARLRLLAGIPEADSAAGPALGAPGWFKPAPSLPERTDVLLQRDLNFVVLATLPPAELLQPNLGVDLGRWQRGDATAAGLLLAAMHCGAVKVAIPMIGDLDADDKMSYFRQLNDLLRKVRSIGIEPAGVILSPSAATERGSGQSTLHMIRNSEDWQRMFNPVLAQIGALLTTWQLGEEAIELSTRAGWRREDADAVRRQLERFVTLPQIVVPVDPLDMPVSAFPPTDGSAESASLAARLDGVFRADEVRTLEVPPGLPTASLARQLGFLAQPGRPECWVRVSAERRGGGLSARGRLEDLARRIVLARALTAERVYVPPPFHLTTQAGGVTWEPEEEFVVLRTLFHCLNGKRIQDVMVLEDAEQRSGSSEDLPGGIAFIFRGAAGSCVVVWSWCDQKRESSADLYLGGQATAVDIWGHPVALRHVGDVTRVPLRSSPILITAVNAPLALLQASFALKPNFVELPESQIQPQLSFQNHYDTPLHGSVSLTPPATWEVEPQEFEFVLGAGERLQRALELRVPPRRVSADDRILQATLRLVTPERSELNFRIPLNIGLRDVEVDADIAWEGDDLLIDYTLRNRSPQEVSFDGFAVAPGRSYAQRAFLNVPPGEAVTQSYRYPAARDLIGTRIRLGIRELNQQRRTFDEVYTVPDPRQN